MNIFKFLTNFSSDRNHNNSSLSFFSQEGEAVQPREKEHGSALTI